MRPDKSLFLNRGLCCALVLFVSAIRADADFLDDINRTFSFGDDSHRFQLSGLVDLEGYYLDQPAPDLIVTNSKFLFNPRLSIFVDAQWTKHFYFFGQVRIDRGFDPSDKGAQIRLDEYFLRYAPLDNKQLNFQVGKFATVVGNWVQRHYSWQNPFVNAPLPYENLTGLWDIAAPDNTDTLLYWGHVGEYDTGDYSDKYLRLPVIWGPSYATGFAVLGFVGKFDYAAEIKNAAIASRPEAWDLTKTNFDNPTFSGRIGVRPNEMWNVGFSASAGPYLRPEAAPTLPAGRSIADYRELFLGQDVSFAWRHLQIWAEVFETRFEVPHIGNADILAYYIEAKYKMTPQLFIAARWNQQFFGTVNDEGPPVRWGNNTSRIDTALGYRFTNYLQVKLQYSFTCTEDNAHLGEQLLATQVTLKF